MSTDVAVQANSSLAIRADQDFWDDKQLAALRQLGVEGATNGDLAVFWHQAVRTGLDPFVRQIYMIERQGKQTIQTGIDGFRLIARRVVDRTGETLGFEPTEWCGHDGVWRDVWLSQDPPAAARVTVLRQGQPYPAVALFTEYAALKRDGSLTSMWSSKPALMLAKCAEALALRRAFPQDLSGIYTSDEMQAAGNPDTVQGTVVRSRPADYQDGNAEGGNPVDVALAGIANASTVEQMQEIWRRIPVKLSVTDRGLVMAAVKARTEELEAAAATGPDQDPDPADDGDVVDAVIVEDTDLPPADDAFPGEPDPVDTDADGRQPVTQTQLKELGAAFMAVGLSPSSADKPKIAAICSYMAGRPVKQRTNLTCAEAAEVLGLLAEIKGSEDPAGQLEIVLTSAMGGAAA